MRNILTNISASGQPTHLKLGELSSLFIVYNITIFFDFIRCIVFDFIFYCVTATTLHTKEKVGSEEQRNSRHIVIIDYDWLKNTRAFSNDLMSLKTESNYSLRSSSLFLLSVPRVNFFTFRGGAFTHATLVLWNSLPLTIRSGSSTSINKKKAEDFSF